MFLLKLFMVSLAAVCICASPTSENPNQSPSRTEKLPSNPSQQKEVEPSIEIVPIPQKSHDDIVKPHRLSKRFIPSYSNQLGFAFKRAGSTWPVDDNHLLRVNDAYSGYRLNNRDFVTSYGPVLDYVLDLSKPKRFFGLLPAKEPRRKDLPPRLGEESAPRFARAFNPNPVEDRRPPPVSVTLRDLLKDYGASWYHVNPFDVGDRQFTAQNFQIDTPININNVQVGMAPDDELLSVFESDYSAIDNVNYSDTKDDENSDDDKQVTSEEKHHPLSRKEEFEKFKTYISLLLSELKDLNSL